MLKRCLKVCGAYTRLSANLEAPEHSFARAYPSDALSETLPAHWWRCAKSVGYKSTGREAQGVEEAVQGHEDANQGVWGSTGVGGSGASPL